MARILVSVLVSFVMFFAAVVSATEVQKPLSPGELVVKINAVSKQMKQLEQRMAQLAELRTRLQGAYQYAIALQDFEKSQTNVSCADGTEGTGECGEEKANP